MSAFGLAFGTGSGVGPAIDSAGGGGGVHGAHRYWRIYITANDGSASFMGFSEVIFRDLAGVDQSTGFNLSFVLADRSSSVNGTNEGNYAFDGDTTTTGWLSATATPGEWIRWDAHDTAGVDVEVGSFDIYGSHNAPTASPKDFELQYSDDGTAWTTARSFTGEIGWAASELRTFTAS